METGKIHVVLYTIPQAACDQNKMNWSDVASLLKNQLENVLQGHVVFKHIEFMSEQWFENQKAQKMLENGDVNFPFVLVNGEIASAEKKINISKIRNYIDQVLKLRTLKKDSHV